MSGQLQNGTEQTFIELDAGSEWRFELEADENIAIRVSGKPTVLLLAICFRRELSRREGQGESRLFAHLRLY
jgi:hypothetical protein